MTEKIEIEVYEKDMLVAEIFVSEDRKTVKMRPHNVTMMNNPLPMIQKLVMLQTFWRIGAFRMKGMGDRKSLE